MFELDKKTKTNKKIPERDEINVETAIRTLLLRKPQNSLNSICLSYCFQILLCDFMKVNSISVEFDFTSKFSLKYFRNE